MVPNTAKNNVHKVCGAQAKFRPLKFFNNPLRRFTTYSVQGKTSCVRRTTSEHDFCVKFAQSAKDYLDQSKLSGRSTYRSLLLKHNVILRSSRTLDWTTDLLFEQLAQMGQEVDGAIFDLRYDAQTAREFFRPQLAPAYKELVQLLRALLPNLPQCPLARYTFVQLLTHWSFVCQLHLIRGWLLCRPKHRGLLDTPDNVVPLCELLIKRCYMDLFIKSLHGNWDIYSDCAIREVQKLQGSRCCCPGSARKLYGLIYILIQGGSTQTARSSLTNSTVLNLVVLMEAEWSWAKRSISHLRELIYTVTGRTLTPNQPCSLASLTSTYETQISMPTSIYEQPLELASALAGMFSIICVLMLQLILVRLTEICRTENLGFRLTVSINNSPMSTIRQVFISYCILAPFCVYLSLYLRLWLTNVILCRSGLIEWFLNSDRFRVSGESAGIDSIYSTQLHKLQFEIYWTWKVVVHYEQRLRDICHQLASDLAHWNMPVPLEYL
ncbi:hypothetical protein D915_002354 [Fasciola hepatica]|uniref:Uncharacterized protein n=1 Tax=Fasciola hepatica TaxID=6192 RepID=A0A4E0RGT7_FASHE|nr:hypothetical protein D915_002354 [Fasciola hepatica]